MRRALLVAALIGAAGCGDDPPGDGLLVMHLDRAAVGTVVARMQFTVATVAVFYDPPPHQGIQPCTLCDLTGATIPPVSNVEATLDFTSTGDSLLGGFPTRPGQISEVRLFVKNLRVTTTDGRTLPGDAPGFHGSIASEVTCLQEPVPGPGPKQTMTVLRLIPGANDVIAVQADETTTVITTFDPNLDFAVLKNTDVTNPDGSPLHILKLRLDSEYNLRLLPSVETRPGLFMDQVTVSFRLGTTRADIDAINAQIGARIVLAPSVSTTYRIKFPTSINLEGAFAFYAGQPEVQAVLPAVNYLVRQLAPNEGTQATQTLANLPLAWESVQTAIGTVGSRRVRVAVIDTGVDTTHPDLAMNIAINQGEIPPALLPTIVDVDGDGITSFADLNDPANAAIRSPDSNGNMIVDCPDLLADPNWADGVDGIDATSLPDDICGWNFTDADNDASPGREHGTMVAGIVGAVGNNGTGVAGTSWAVSIVPIRTTFLSMEPTGDSVMPDVLFFDALTYVENEGIDIVNFSAGWDFASENAGLACAFTKRGITTGVPQGQFDAAVAAGSGAFAMPPWTDGAGNSTSRVLYVLAAGNQSLNIADPNVIDIPGELMQAAIPQNVLMVGNAQSATQNSGTSSYGAPVVNIWAPGVNWRSLVPGGGTDTGSGTSFSAPAVAGVAALMLARSPALSGNPSALQSRIIGTASPSIDVNVGCGVVDTDQSLMDANASVQP